MNIKKNLTRRFESHKERNLEFWTMRTGSEKAALFRLRNAAIDEVVRSYDRSNPAFLYHSKPIHDVIESEDRANHYGLPIGTTLNTYYRKRNNYNSRLAEFKASVRSESLGML